MSSLIGGFVGKPEREREEYRRFLQQSVEMRMRAIHEKLSLASTFCNTVEIEVRFRDFARARVLLQKVTSTIQALTAHINDPGHVSDTLHKQEFRKQLTQLQQRISLLDSQISQGHSRRR